MRKFLDKIIFVLFLVEIVFTALAHGAVEPWSVAVSSAGIVGLLFLWGLKGNLEKQWLLRLPSPVWPLLALIGLGLLQSLSWTDSAGQRASLSLDVEATRDAVLGLSLLLIAFVLAANLFVRRERLIIWGQFLSYFGLALSLFALLQQATWNGRFYWIRAVNTQEVTAPFGPFVHHGHYAGYLELLLPIPIALLITNKLPLDKKLLYGFAATSIGVSIIASLARGGMIVLGAQLIFLGVMGSRIRRQGKTEIENQANSFRSLFIRYGAVLAISASILLGVFWLGADSILNRIVQGQGADTTQQAGFFNNRGWIWRDAAAMFRAHPFIGVGLGAFETAFPIYSLNDGSLTVSAAHNDYLQVLAEGGLLGGALMVWFIVIVLRLLTKALQSHDAQMQALALGSGAGMVGMFVHSFFDFNLQLPSHAWLFLTLVAVVSRLGERVAEKEAALVEMLPQTTPYFEVAEGLSKRRAI